MQLKKIQACQHNLDNSIPIFQNGPGNSNGDKLANANKCNNVRQKSFAKTDEKKAVLPTTSAGTAQTTSANARNKQDQMKVRCKPKEKKKKLQWCAIEFLHLLQKPY